MQSTLPAPGRDGQPNLPNVSFVFMIFPAFLFSCLSAFLLFYFITGLLRCAFASVCLCFCVCLSCQFVNVWKVIEWRNCRKNFDDNLPYRAASSSSCLFSNVHKFSNSKTQHFRFTSLAPCPLALVYSFNGRGVSGCGVRGWSVNG